MSRAFLIALLTALASASCGTGTTTSPTSTTPLRTDEVFGGQLGVGDSHFYSFTAVSPGTTDVTLVSLRPVGVKTSTLAPVVGLGLGTPSGTTCALSSALNTAPALSRQLSVTTDVSTYCVMIADVGNLTDTVDYTIRIVHP
jgi:hypothetical protein